MSAHTPGPWVFHDCIGGCSVQAGWREVLAYLHSPDAENKANARLIATAPELLAALTEMLAMCDRQTNFHDDGDGHMLDRAIAAIAKSTGAP